jgi:carbamoyl-phosphate synthase large subunit
VRRRDVVQDGEAAVTTTVRDPELEDVARSVLAWLPARGPVNVQLLRTEDGQVHIVELNARFGGASTCSVRAGLDLWAWELSEHRGLDPEPFRRLAGEVRQTRERLPDGSVTDRIELLGLGP